MKNYIFFTSKETTESLVGGNVNNVQFLGLVRGDNEESAKKTLLKENQWILESGFKEDCIIGKQLIDDFFKNLVAKVVSYLWEDEEKHYEEDPNNNHIFLILKELKDLIK